jgi:hypothetical protein
LNDWVIKDWNLNSVGFPFFLRQEKYGQIWNPGFPPVRRLHAALLRFPYEKPSSWLFFLPNFFWAKKLARTGTPRALAKARVCRGGGLG